jgi:hypothetical protein
MKKPRIDQMLQECLDGYEAGLTPDECLSAYPERRRELEPLLRQALSLRIAYATNPSDEVRHQVRERLMFAAGRDVKLALARDPDPNFILQERTRFLNRAGASAQEALRDVPPPRLAFWVNARRRLLDAAPGTAPAPARRFGNALRYSMSAAAVAIVVAIGAVVVLDGSGGTTTNPADAQLAALEQQITDLEQRSLQGQRVSTGELEDLAEKTSLITNTIDQFDDERADKIGGLILKQQDFAEQAASEGDDLSAVQQTLLDAQQKLGGAEPTATAAAAVVGPTQAPAPTATSEPAVEPTPEPLAPGEVRVEDTDDTTLDLAWQQVSTENFSFLIPDTWRLWVDEGEDGELTFSGDFLALDTDGDAPIIVLVTLDGETIARVNGVALTLREAGPDGATIPAETLAQFGDVGPALHTFVLSISLSPTTP